jgi:hypothetical protein
MLYWNIRDVVLAAPPKTPGYLILKNLKYEYLKPLADIWVMPTEIRFGIVELLYSPKVYSAYIWRIS